MIKHKNNLIQQTSCISEIDLLTPADLLNHAGSIAWVILIVHVLAQVKQITHNIAQHSTSMG